MSRSIFNSCFNKRNICGYLFGESKKGIKIHQKKFLENRENVNLISTTWSQLRWFASNKNEKQQTKAIVKSSDFANVSDKNKETYLEMVGIYKEKEKFRRGHVEFIYSALKHMKEFGVEKDLEVYKSLIDVLPKGTMIPRNMFQVEFMHYPKQQQCAIDLLEQMEENGVMPDWDMEDQLVNVFGTKGYPVRRYWRMMYWMPKFKNASPWLLPEIIPNDTYELALLAIKRMISVDPNSEISTFQTSDVEGSLEDTWIISGQSPDQKLLLSNLSDSTPLFVEGRFRIWIKNKSVTYFILRADVFTKEEEQIEEDVSKLKNPLFTKPNLLPKKIPTVHEQEHGLILAVCSTGTSSRDSLLSWIRSLEKLNPTLTKLPVVFTLKAPSDESDSSNSEIKTIEESLTRLCK